MPAIQVPTSTGGPTQPIILPYSSPIPQPASVVQVAAVTDVNETLSEAQPDVASVAQPKSNTLLYAIVITLALAGAAAVYFFLIRKKGKK
jgi:hypothetical protein